MTEEKFEQHCWRVSSIYTHYIGRCKRDKCCNFFMTDKSTKNYCSEACRKYDEKKRALERRHVIQVDNCYDEFDLKNKYEVPKELITKNCGVYFLFLLDEIVYIGSSKDLLKRIYTHYTGKTNIQFDRVFIRFCEEEVCYDLENVYINKYKPIHNLQGVKIRDIVTWT